jgi:hypothetical protein
MGVTNIMSRHEEHAFFGLTDIKPRTFGKNNKIPLRIGGSGNALPAFQMAQALTIFGGETTSAASQP